MLIAMLNGDSCAQVGRQQCLGRVTPGNWPKVFTDLPQDYGAMRLASVRTYLDIYTVGAYALGY